MAAPARADDRPPVRVELAPCLDAEREAIDRAVRIEVGAADGPSAVSVRIDCATDGVDAGVVIEVRPPDSARRYRYALDWSAQPLDARPRLLGLAVAEAVDASRIELVAVAEPRPAAVASPPVAVWRPSDWSIALAVERRAFSAEHGVALIGLGIAPARRLAGALWLAADLVGEGATVLSSSGAVIARAVSAAPRIAYRAGRRVHGELGLGARVGVVTFSGESLPQSQLVGQRSTRAWLGPAASLALGVELTPRIAISAGVELGRVVAGGGTARDLGRPIAGVDGTWTSIALAATVELER